MAEHSNRPAILAEALCQIASERIRLPAQFAVRQGSTVANVCCCFRGYCGPAIDSLDQIHSETLINKRRRREIAASIHKDQGQDDGEVIENQQYAMQRGMFLKPAHMRSRCWRSVIIFRGVCQLSRSNSAGETLMPNCSSIIK